MVGIRGLCPSATLADLQSIPFYNVVEAVVPNGVVFAELLLLHAPKLAAAYATVAFADAFDKLDDECLRSYLAHLCVIMLIVGLSCYTKQPAERSDGIKSQITLMEPTDYLVPAFFKSMPYTSLPNATISS